MTPNGSWNKRAEHFNGQVYVSCFINVVSQQSGFCIVKMTLREKCPNTEFFLVRIFLYLSWIHISIYLYRISYSEYVYSVNVRIWFEYRKIRARKNSVFGYFSRSVITLNLLLQQVSCLNVSKPFFTVHNKPFYTVDLNQTN